MSEKLYEQKIREMNNLRISSVSLIIVQLLIFITYTVKIVSEYFETNITFQVANNNLLDIGIVFLLVSILLLVLVLIPYINIIDLTDEKAVKKFKLFYKIQHLIYLFGYYLMIFGIYLIVGIILLSIGITSLPVQLFAILLLSIIVFILIKSIVSIVSLWCDFFMFKYIYIAFVCYNLKK